MAFEPQRIGDTDAVIQISITWVFLKLFQNSQDLSFKKVAGLSL